MTEGNSDERGHQNAPGLYSTHSRTAQRLTGDAGALRGADDAGANLRRLPCDDGVSCLAQSRSHAINWLVSFADYGIPPAGKRAVIELVAAQILVPQGEWVRLRMFTSLGSIASNIDLFVTPQGVVSGQAIYDATHSIRAYSDGPIEFDINRDNAVTPGHALICISGYIVG